MASRTPKVRLSVMHVCETATDDEAMQSARSFVVTALVDGLDVPAGGGASQLQSPPKPRRSQTSARPFTCQVHSRLS